MKRSVLAVAAAVVMQFSTPAAAQQLSQWPQASPGALGFRADLSEVLRRELTEAVPRLTSFGVLRDRKLAFSYFRDPASSVGERLRTGPDVPQNVASVTKSVLALLVGIALDKRIFGSVRDPLARHLKEADDPALDPRVRSLTLEHLLTMTGGWQVNDSDLPPFRFEDALKRPFAFDPGQRFQYDNATSHLLGVALMRASGMPLERFAEEHLFGPMGIGNLSWRKDAFGHTMGWHNLHLTLDDMLKIGQLLLDNGAWSGQQIVSAHYIGEMLTRRNAGGPPSNTPYGFHWYIMSTPDRSHAAYGAFGYGGQLIYVVPALKLVLAQTQTRDQRGTGSRFIREIVMPGLAP
jgi:CubicO group peptidase (beta-lactamase class C family)